MNFINVTFEQFNTSLLNKSINFFFKKKKKQSLTFERIVLVELLPSIPLIHRGIISYSCCCVKSVTWVIVAININSSRH